MKVAVIGSFKVEGGSKDAFEDFKKAAFQIGQALAKAGHEIVVDGDLPNTANPYVVEGAAKTPGKHKVRIFFSSGGPIPFEKEQQLYEDSIQFTDWSQPGPPTARQLAALNAVDGIILIGGSIGTGQAGFSAPLLNKAVVCLPHFGGSASDLWPMVQLRYERLGHSNIALNTLNKPWDEDASAAAAVELLECAVQHGWFKPSSRRGSYAILFTTVVLAVGWIALFTWRPLIVDPARPPLITFFALLGLAAMIGSSMRMVLNAREPQNPPITMDQFVADATAGILLAFALAVLYMAGGAVMTAGGEFLKNMGTDTEFVRVALTMSLIGIAGGLLIEKVSNRIRGALSAMLDLDKAY